ncbi:tetratricopeptide repeat protein [Paenalcaligenes sp. Me131]|uniref:tetratricopeptide repeat protein n=1 Tax=Paenalcaligenes sp. Me131 TaxID=3392636 RepID=UPI003D2C6966
MAQVALGTKYMYGEELPRDEEQAFSWYLKAAEQGVAPGSVAYMYATGTGVAQNDQEAAVWYAKGAEQGDAVSQVNLGRYYEHGTGVEENMDKAKALYQASCDGGNYSGCDELKRLQTP